MIEVDVRTYDLAWTNFMQNMELVYGLDAISDDSSKLDWEQALTIELAKINATDVPQTCYVRFHSENDLTWFLLKWS